MDGQQSQALIDTGCTDTLVHASLCRDWTPKQTEMVTVDGGRLECVGSTCVEVVCQGRRVMLDALVVGERPLGLVDVLIGMSGIVSLGGVAVRTPLQVSVGGGLAGATTRTGPRELTVEGKDFSGEFRNGEWVVRWKWLNGVAPDGLANKVEQYAIPVGIRQAYNHELQAWIDEGWLVPYREEEFGRARALIPLMAVDQPHKGKVRPVLDFRELNSHIPVHAANADVCAEELRKWRRHGVKVAVVDLEKAYLQLHIDRSLWPYQTVVINGQLYCLGRLGFGLNVAPSIMKAVVQAVLDQDDRIKKAVLAYVDDLLVDESVATADEVIAHFADFGLKCKTPQRAAEGAVRALGLRVTPREDGQLRWERDNELSAPPSVLTRRSVFQWCGTLTAHLPVAGWLRPAVAWLKRVVNNLTKGWDDPVSDEGLVSQVKAVHARVRSEDPARGRWDFGGDSVTVWTDASAIATGVVLEDSAGNVLEDACWLRSERDSSSHINMAELDAATKGINLAILWGARNIALRTDSATVCHWIGDALSGRARLRSKAQGEMLIRRRLGVVTQLVEEFGLKVDVTLVSSGENPADVLTRVPRQWLQRRDRLPVGRDGAPVAASGSAAAGCAGAVAEKVQIASIHGQVGHPGVRRTLWYARRELPGTLVRRADVRDVIASCDVCQSIDPAPQRWRHGTLAVQADWERLAIDVTHIGGVAYLTVIDCGPTRFALWRALRRGTGEEITGMLEQIFLERGAPVELLLDNATEFRGRVMRAFAAQWRVVLRFRAAYEAGGNGIIERHHRTVKVMAARQQCSVQEAVHRYNATPRGEGEARAPAAGVYRYRFRDLPINLEECGGAEVSAPTPQEWRTGDRVWVRRRGLDRCVDRSKAGVVTGVQSDQVLEVDGMPWHVRNVRRRRDGLNVTEPERARPLSIGLGGGGMGGPGLPLAVDRSEQRVADRPVREQGSGDATDETDGQVEEQEGGDATDESGYQVEVDRTGVTDLAEAGAEALAEAEEGEGGQREEATAYSPFAHVNMYNVLPDDDAGEDVERAAPRRSERIRRFPSEVYGTRIDSNSIDLRTLRRPSRARNDK